MPERASITQGVQIGVETTPGTSVAASKLLNSIGFDLGMEVDFQRFQPMGQKFASIITPGKEWSGIEISGVGSYSELQYALASALNYAAPVQQAATTAYKWTFSPAARAEDTIKTFTIETGGVVRAHKATYCLFDSVSVNWSRDGVEVGGSGIGQRITDAITLTASPTAIEEIPILANETSVYIDTTSAGLGTTKLTRHLSGSFAMGSRFSPLWVVDAAQASFAAHVETQPSTTVTLMVEADTQGMSLLSTMRAGTTQFIRVHMVSPQLAGTAIPYSLRMDFAAKVSGVSRFSDQDGVYAIEWTFEPVYDSTWGKAMQIELINKQTLL